MSNNIILTNVTDPDIMKEVQAKTFKLLREYLEPSFGPKGSNTGILAADEKVKYTKDGHSILKAIIFQNPIETSIKNNIEELTRNIVVKVGDGTTSAVILSHLIHEGISDFLNGYSKTNKINPYDFNRSFDSVVRAINEHILNRAKEFTSDTAYDISMISTNGNERVSKNISDIYDKFGNDVFIDVGVSPSEETLLKEYDGITLETGYDESCYVNTSDGRASIKNPEIYMFKDPVDTVEQVSFLKAIINRFMESLQNSDPIPTVIMAPKITRDASIVMTTVSDILGKFDISNRPPLLILANVHDEEKYDDIKLLTGAKYIKKYIDPVIQEQEIKEGLAPTFENFHTFAGSAELVESNFTMTKIVNPSCMYDEDANYTDVYTSLVDYLEAELVSITNNSNDLKEKHQLKKRIQSLKASMVEYLVGGMTILDRDKDRDLVEDAILNCRSASKHGYGHAANCEGLIASKHIIGTLSSEMEKSIGEIIHKAYLDLVYILIDKNTDIKGLDIYKIINAIIINNSPYDVRECEFSTKVISSIYSDIYILEAINKIVTLIVTANQFIVPDVHYNKYMNKDKI